MLIHAASRLAMYAESEELGWRLAAFGKLAWRIVRDDGSVRQLDVNYLSDATMPLVSADNNAIRRVALRVVAHDPVWYDPEPKTFYYSASSSAGTWILTGAGTDLSFPASFSSIVVGFSSVLAYAGTWKSYPIIVLDGPIQNPEIHNDTTGETLDFDGHAVADGETLTIDCRYGYKTVIYSATGNAIDWLTTDSDLGTWHIAGKNEIADGNNDIRVEGTGVGANTQVRIQYYERYIVV